MRCLDAAVRELSLLNHIYAANAALPPRVTIPPGDDMGAVTVGGPTPSPRSGGESPGGRGEGAQSTATRGITNPLPTLGETVLVTVDQIADGVHFRLSTTPLSRIARKAITRNLSDVAAMGAVPVAAVVAGCLPRGFGEMRANELFDHMRQVAASYDCPLIGGDISMWDHALLLSVTVLAEPRGVAPILRSGAQSGDIICVTGALGGSLEEIALQFPEGAPRPTCAPLLGYIHHLDFEPRLTVARQLASHPDIRPHCMIDLSDGLGKDLAHLCLPLPSSHLPAPSSHLPLPSALSAELWLDKLPISRGAVQASQRDGKPPWQHALGDGEDYELCFTVSPAKAARLPREIDGVPIARIGFMKPRGETLITLVHPDGSRQPMGEQGWEHHD